MTTALHIQESIFDTIIEMMSEDDIFAVQLMSEFDKLLMSSLSQVVFAIALSFVDGDMDSVV